MKVAVVSDTHDNRSASVELVNTLKSRGISTVVHLGDIVSPFTLKIFAGFRYFGVFGNNDGERLLLKRVADENGMLLEEQPAMLKLGGKDFLLYHGSGSVEKTRRTVEGFAKSGDYDFVLYGHTHMVDHRRIGDTLILNPGEACGYLTGRRTFAVLDVETGEFEIVEF